MHKTILYLSLVAFLTLLSNGQCLAEEFNSTKGGSIMSDYYNEDDESLWEKTKDLSASAWEATKEGAAKAWDKTKELSNKAFDSTKETAEEAVDKTKEFNHEAWDKTKEMSSKAWENTKEGAEKTGEYIADKSSKAWEATKDALTPDNNEENRFKTDHQNTDDPANPMFNPDNKHSPDENYQHRND